MPVLLALPGRKQLMTEDRTTPPHLRPPRPEFAGSLAEHVRQYQTDDPGTAGLRDRLAGAAEGYSEHHQDAPPVPQGPAQSAHEASQPEQPAEVAEEWLDTV